MCPRRRAHILSNETAILEMLEHSKINFDYIYLLLVHVNESEKLIPRTNDEN